LMNALTLESTLDNLHAESRNLFDYRRECGSILGG
jgi:hypothetical protein